MINYLKTCDNFTINLLRTATSQYVFIYMSHTFIVSQKAKLRTV